MQNSKRPIHNEPTLATNKKNNGGEKKCNVNAKNANTNGITKEQQKKDKKQVAQCANQKY